MKKLKITSGERYGMVSILKEVPKQEKERMVLVLCKCGTQKVVSFNHLRSGHTKSCGCFSLIKKTNHNLSKTKFYFIFRGMLSRCNNKNNVAYPRYGGRGIKVEWLSFDEFINDMYPSYKEGLTIERINNNVSYNKKNCKWATRKEQVNNRFVTIKYKNESANEADCRLGGKPGLVWNRINILGWSTKKAFNTPNTKKG